MSIFSPKENSYVGIDFHTNGVKVVALKNANGRPELMTYGYVDVGFERPNLQVDGAQQEKIAKVITQVCREAQVTSRNVISCLPAHFIFSSILTLSATPKKQLPAVINREAEQIIPMPLKNMVLDWKVLKSVESNAPTAPSTQAMPEKSDTRSHLRINPEKKQKTMRVLLTAAPKDAVKNYIQIFKLAKLNLLTLDTEHFALIRSLVGNDPSALMIVDIGFATTNVMIVVGGVPFMHRNVQVGGGMITRALAEKMKITPAQAEQFKLDLSVAGGHDLQRSVPADIALLTRPLLDEIKYSLDIYKKQSPRPIEKIILTGGSSLLLNLPEYMSQVLRMRVFRGDPWARVMYPNELRPVLDEIGARFSVAVGLGMRYIS